jgi:hypothetical protein
VNGGEEGTPAVGRRRGQRAAWQRVSGIVMFAAVSGSGLAADILIFLGLIKIGLPALLANAISATCAVTWVYFASVKRIFSYKGDFLITLFFAYVAYQVAAIAAASGAVELLARTEMRPLTAKLVILPITFTANYAFMAWLTRRGRSRPN